MYECVFVEKERVNHVVGQLSVSEQYMYRFRHYN